MHIHIIDIILIYSFIFLGCKSNKTLVVDVNPEWIAACYESIDSHVELEAFVEEGVLQIDLNHALPVTFDLSHV
jgi:hypothetical protein